VAGGRYWDRTSDDQRTGIYYQPSDAYAANARGTRNVTDGSKQEYVTRNAIAAFAVVHTLHL
jgi:hypothetical protein